MDITVSSGIFDKAICWLIVTGELKDFFSYVFTIFKKKCILNVTFLLKRKKE